jgi:predicted dehydrogenase
MAETLVDSTPSRTIRIGVVGCGVVATAYYLPWLMDAPGVEITAVCDRSQVRTDACQRLFGARSAYSDYHEMLRRADIEAVMILTGPGTHAAFTLAALAAGKHVLLQKPMALDLNDAAAIRDAVRRTRLKVLIEPSDHSPLDPLYQRLRALVRRGVLGGPYWFSLMLKGPEHDHPSLGGNPYGESAFYSRDSGGILFDFPYGPNQIVSVLGSCRSVSALVRTSQPDRAIVHDRHYDAFLADCTDPHQANYWRRVFDLPRDQRIRSEAPDNVLCMFEMADGSIGAFHTPRLFVPTAPGTSYGGLQVFGTEGNLVMHHAQRASVRTLRQELLPEAGPDGWYHIPYDRPEEPAPWPIPPKGSWNYYHESTRHWLACIRDDRTPVCDVEWGFHITEMMTGAMESARTGSRYLMTSAVSW